MESISAREERAKSVIRRYYNEGVLIHSVPPIYFPVVKKYWRVQSENYLYKKRQDSVDSEAAEKELHSEDPRTNLSTTYLQKEQKSCIAFTLKTSFGVIFDNEQVEILALYSEDSFTDNRIVLEKKDFDHKLQKPLNKDIFRGKYNQSPSKNYNLYKQSVAEKYADKGFIVVTGDEVLQQNLSVRKSNKYDRYKDYLGNEKELAVKNILLALSKEASWKNKSPCALHNEILIAPVELDKKIKALFFFFNGHIGTESFHIAKQISPAQSWQQVHKFAAEHGLPIILIGSSPRGELIDIESLSIDSSLQKELDEYYKLPSVHYLGYYGTLHQTESAVYQFRKYCQEAHEQEPHIFIKKYGIRTYEFEFILSLLFIRDGETVKAYAKQYYSIIRNYYLFAGYFRELNQVFWTMKLNPEDKLNLAEKKNSLLYAIDVLLKNTDTELERLQLLEVLGLMMVCDKSTVSTERSHYVAKERLAIKNNEIFNEIKIYKPIKPAEEFKLAETKSLSRATLYNAEYKKDMHDNFIITPIKKQYYISEFIHKIPRQYGFQIIPSNARIFFIVFAEDGEEKKFNIEDMIPASYKYHFAKYYAMDSCTVEYDGENGLDRHHAAVIANFRLRNPGNSFVVGKHKYLNAEFMEKFLAVHDLGKGINRKNQHHETCQLLTKHRQYLGVTDIQFKIMIGLLSGDYFGEYIRKSLHASVDHGSNLKNAADKIFMMLQNINFELLEDDQLDVDDLFLLLTEYYNADARSYFKIQCNLIKYNKEVKENIIILKNTVKDIYIAAQKMIIDLAIDSPGNKTETDSTGTESLNTLSPSE